MRLHRARPWLIVCGALIVALGAACSSPPIDAVRAADAATDPAEAAAQGVVPADFVTPPSWSLPRLDPADEPSWGSLLSTSDAGKQRAFRPVDAVTAFDLPGYAAPYAEDRSFRIRAISPDGRLAAVSALSTQESSSARLHLFRLDSWTTVASSSGTLPLGSLVWSPDGSRLIGTRTICHGPRPEGRCDRRQRDLVVIPVDGGTALEPQVLAELDFMIDALWIDPGGEKLYAFAWRSDVCCGIEIEGAPFVAVIDTRSGEIRAEIELPDLLVGQHMEQRGRGIQSVRYGAGLAMAPDGSRLYVAHSDANRVTVIDLEALRVERTVDIEPALHALPVPVVALRTLREPRGGEGRTGLHEAGRGHTGRATATRDGEGRRAARW